MRQDKTGENRELCSVGGGVQTTDAHGNADMCSRSALCSSRSAHTGILRDAEFSFIAQFYLFSYVWQIHRFYHLVVGENILRSSGCVKKRGTFSLAAILEPAFSICHSKQCETSNMMLSINSHFLNGINMLMWMYQHK